MFVLCCCGTGAKEEGGAPKVPPACSLLSKEQVGKILGEELSSPKEDVRKNKQGAVMMSSCTFSSRGADSSTSFNILVVPRDNRHSPQAALAEHLRSLKDNLKDQSYTLEAVAGVGQAAGYDPLVGQLTIIDHHRMMIFTLKKKPQGQNKELLIKLALAALSKQ
jgi:hypothetical protein